MTADIVIRGGTLVDGTGAPARTADIALTDGVVSDIGDGLDGKRVLEADGQHRLARLRRHPHPLRRPGVLGPGAHPVVLARRHLGRGRQLRLLDRAGSARAPRAARPHVAARRGHGGRHAVRGRAVDRLRDLPAVLRRHRAARHAPQLRLLRRPHRGAPLRDGRVGLRAGRHRRRRARHAARDRRSDRRGRGRVRDVGVAHAQRRQGPAGAVTRRRPRRSARARRAAARRAQGRRRAAPRREGHARRRVRRAARGGPSRHVDRAAHGEGLPVARAHHGGQHRGARRRLRGVAAGFVPAAHVPDEPARAVHLQHASGVPGADGPPARRAHRRVPRSRVARSRVGRALRPRAASARCR